MSTAKSIICFFFEHNLPKPSRDVEGHRRRFLRKRPRALTLAIMTMTAKPMKTPEMHYLMIQLMIITNTQRSHARYSYNGKLFLFLEYLRNSALFASLHSLM